MTWKDLFRGMFRVPQSAARHHSHSASPRRVGRHRRAYSLARVPVRALRAVTAYSAHARHMSQRTLFGEQAASANAAVHVKVNKTRRTWTFEVQVSALRPYGTSVLSSEGLTAVARARVHPPARVSPPKVKG